MDVWAKDGLMILGLEAQGLSCIPHHSTVALHCHKRNQSSQVSNLGAWLGRGHQLSPDTTVHWIKNSTTFACSLHSAKTFRSWKIREGVRRMRRRRRRRSLVRKDCRLTPCIAKFVLLFTVIGRLRRHLLQWYNQLHNHWRFHGSDAEETQVTWPWTRYHWGLGKMQNKLPPAALHFHQVCSVCHLRLTVEDFSATSVSWFGAGDGGESGGGGGGGAVGGRSDSDCCCWSSLLGDCNERQNKQLSQGVGHMAEGCNPQQLGHNPKLL